MSGVTGKTVGHTERIGERVSTGGGGRVLDELAILDIEAADFHKITRRRATVGNELSNNSELLRSIDSEAGAVVGVVALGVWVKTAATSITLTRAPRAGASVWPVLLATVRGESVGNGVGLPNVHLIAAEALVVHVGLRKTEVR